MYLKKVKGEKWTWNLVDDIYDRWDGPSKYTHASVCSFDFNSKKGWRISLL